MRRRAVQLSSKSMRAKPVVVNDWGDSKVGKITKELDKIGLQTGFLLKQSPVLRLLFIGYVIILNLWTAYIMFQHMPSHIDSDAAHPDAHIHAYHAVKETVRAAIAMNQTVVSGHSVHLDISHNGHAHSD